MQTRGGRVAEVVWHASGADEHVLDLGEANEDPTPGELVQRQRADTAFRMLRDSYAATVLALTRALELRDGATGGHAERVVDLAMRLTCRAAPQLLDDPSLEQGFLLHDIGKIAVPDAILLKPGPLDANELRTMQLHPTLGAKIIGAVPNLRGVARDVICAHHERWDGRGYPHGLAGTEIPIAARIFALADAYDAMTNDRPYRRALTQDEALREIAANTGTQFDPRLTAEFLALVAEGTQAA